MVITFQFWTSAASFSNFAGNPQYHAVRLHLSSKVQDFTAGIAARMCLERRRRATHASS